MNALSENARGALLMAAGMAAFTVNDTFMKLLSEELPLFQALFLRGLGTCLAFVIVAYWLGLLRLRLPRRDWGLIALRSVGEIGAAWFFMTALFNMPLANVTAILQSLPLAITLAGALFLGEAVGWRRLGAVLAGFGGVLLIVRPGFEGFTSYSVLALISVGFVTLRDLATRRLSAEVPSMTVALLTAASVTVFAGIGAAFDDWSAPSRGATVLIGLATVAIIAGYMLSVLAVRVGEMSFVAPFRYSAMLWALVLGLFVFGDWPDFLTLAGCAVIVGTGVFTFHRERKLNRQLAAAREGPAASPRL